MAGPSSKTSKFAKSRKFIRYAPDPMTVAYIDFEFKRDFKPSLAAIVVSESYGGVGVCIPYTPLARVGEKLTIRVGDLSPMLAEAVWVEKVDRDILKLGIRFLE